MFSLFAYFALLDSNNNVRQVIVADEKFISSHPPAKGMRYVETFMDGGEKKNYAAPGFTYSEEKEAFIPQKPHDSFVLDEQTARWKAPVEYPKDGKGYVWNEKTKSWTPIVRTTQVKK